MVITIHQAICGEHNKAWDLLRTTLPDNATAKKIAFKADLQDSPPSGVSWEPVIRGFSFNEYYLLIKTYPDTSPDVRNGRVFSHCLIILKADLPLISDLREIFSFFKNEIDKAILLEPIRFIATNESKIILKDTLQLRFNKAIRGFIALLNNTGSIVWVGQKHYEIVVAKFWQLLSPLQKESFNFGINFNPSEVPDEKINFIVIPENIETKFDGKGYCIIRKNDSVVLSEFSEQFLAGEENASNRLIKFTDAIDIKIKGFTTREISTIAKGVGTFENLNETIDLKLLNTLSNIVAKYSSDEKKGATFKKQLIERICTLVESASVNDILLLKNFQTKYFKDSEKKISQAVNKWIDNYLFVEKENKKEDFTPIITQIYDPIPANWLKSLFRGKTRDFLSSVNRTHAVVIWRWIANDIKLLKLISSEINNSKPSEAIFCETFSASFEKIDLKEIKTFAVKRNWLKLHATIVKSEFDFASAVTEQLKIDSDPDYFEAINVILTGIKPKEIIDVTVAKGDWRLFSIAGRLCKSDQSLLEKIEIDNYNWQEILLASVKNGNKLVDGIKEPKKLFYKLYDALLEGKAVSENLLELLSETEYANILDYSNRNKIWKKFPVGLKNRFLDKTASSILESLSKDSTFPLPADRELSDYIISSGISTFLYYNRNNIKVTLVIFNTFTQVPENILRDYISNYSGKLDIVDATQLGKLVATRNYDSVAYAIYQKVFSNRQFKIALAECYSLLDFITRGFAWSLGAISNIEVSEDEWWVAFTELSYKLYSSGATENKIWAQADGKEYDLLTRGTGKEVWISALQKLRRGGCTGITTKKLLKEMLKEHGNNEELKTLKDLWTKL